jgi:hypothetical protein
MVMFRESDARETYSLARGVVGRNLHFQSLSSVAQVLRSEHRDLLADQEGSL